MPQSLKPKLTGSLHDKLRRAAAEQWLLFRISLRPESAAMFLPGLRSAIHSELPFGLLLFVPFLHVHVQSKGSSTPTDLNSDKHSFTGPPGAGSSGCPKVSRGLRC